ncbi:MAG: acetyl-CoA hydrolase/transferase family protein [Gammaproteobacteria bacterium]|nr:acetyl-CoA hydrolase/transferase family protein [Gammaproteobacteria bacterium]
MNYSDKIVSAEKAVEKIKSNDIIFIGGGAVVPRDLIQAMTKRHNELRNVQLHHILTLGTTEDTAPYTMPGMEKSFTHYALFIGQNTRKAQNAGTAYWVPIFLSEAPDYFRNLDIDVAMIKVSPPDPRGFCSLGTSVDVSRAALESAKYVIAEINPSVPNTQGYSFIHVDDIDVMVETEQPIYEVPNSEISETQREIGRNVASLIDDGACLQVGIGNIPNATLEFLVNHKHLGVHSELISDGIMKLVQCGAIDNSQKNLNVGKLVTGIIMGSRELYQWVDKNPIIEMRPSDYTNDPFLIARNDNVAAINTALAIDLKGQVSADSLGRLFYSGIGGQVDFIRGASRSKNGKPIIALPSTAKRDGKLLSRITAELTPGSGVVTSEGDVHYVVTEYGIAELQHKAMGERAHALIKIAHPDFRDELEEYASTSGYRLN